MFCYQCGCQVDAHDRYCPQCGVQLIDNKQEPQCVSAENEYFNIATPSIQPKNIARGYILTHVEALSSHLNVNYDKLTDILEEFVMKRSKAGISYKIIDMSHHINNPENAKWTDFHKIVTQYYIRDWNDGMVPNYLFIIGGSDIIPMPSIPLKPTNNDEDIDSDLPYGYIYEDKIEESIANLSIFKKPSILLCGRLPLASDTTFNDFTKMLSNILVAGQKGLLNMNLHVQCDPNWKNITTLVAEGLQEYMPQRSEKNDFFHGPIMLTPQFEPGTETFDSNFPYRQASIFYYNLHGTDTPGTDPFFGQKIGKGEFHSALYPKNMEVITQPNIVVTEACYGGWFKRFRNQGESKKKCETILLSAMHAATVCYVGSSRIAYGAADPHDELLFADILASEFLQSLYRGNPAGIAFQHAKLAVLSGEVNYYKFVTTFEFNLFGDPALSAVTYPGEYSHKSCGTALLSKDAPIISEHKVEYDFELSKGILNHVRNLVNWNLREINNLVTEHLYNQYGVAPRQLNYVLSSKSSDGICQYICFYASDNGEWMVGMDKESKKILYTACSKTINL